MMQHTDWNYRFAAYMALGYICEACKHAYKKNIDEVFRIAVSGINDPDDRVKWASHFCMALMLSDLAPLPQRQFHGEIMEKLISLFKNTE